MHTELVKIYEIYRSIEDVVLLDSIEYLKSLSQEELAYYGKSRNAASKILTDTVNRSFTIIQNLTVAEIIEAYTEAGIILKKNLGGYMYSYFHETFIPTMINGIKNGDSSAYLFLGRLSEHLPRPDLIALIKTALYLKERRLRETALGLIEQLKITELISEVHRLELDTDKNIAEQAKSVRAILENEFS